MNGSGPVISVIVPTFARPGRAGTCLARLAAASDRVENLEVIVVEQSKTAPGSSDQSRANSVPLNVTWLCLDRPNVSAARNAGAAAAAGMLLLFIDDDVELAPTYITKLIGLFDAGVADVLGGEYVTAFLDETNSPPDDPSHHRPWSAQWLPGGNIALRREDFFLVGGFDENLYSYNEDAEFCYRAQHAGLRLGRHPRLQAIHHHEPSGGTWHDDQSVLSKVRDVSRNNLYFTHAVGGGMRDLLVTVMRDFKVIMRGKGRVAGGTAFGRLAAWGVALPEAIAYAFRPPRLIKHLPRTGQRDNGRSGNTADGFI